MSSAPGFGPDPSSGRLNRLAWAIGASILLVALDLAVSGPTLGAQDPWQPRGHDLPDRERYEAAPSSFDDRQGPVEVEPPGHARVATTDRTSIVVVMIDDLAQIDQRVWQRLPRIRALFLAQGLQFSRYYGNDPLCCPGRATFLTGLTTDHHGVWTNDPSQFDPHVTVATELRQQGYHTFLAGKYFNGAASPIDRTPPGWSRIAWTANAYYRYNEWVDGRRVYHDDDPDDFQPDVAFNRALRFLREAPRNRPVFGVVTPFTVHAGADPHRRVSLAGQPPTAPRFRHSRRCDGVERWKTAAHADDNSDRPVYQREWDEFRAGYPLFPICRALLAVDAGIGRLVGELRRQGRLRETLLVLTSDNGMAWGAHGAYGKSLSFATQMPLLVHWPAGRGTSPRTDATYVSNVDLAPTLCEIGGCTMGPFLGGPDEADGTSLLSVIKGTGELRRQAIYSEHLATPLWRQLITTSDSPLGLWHYVEYGTGERELYDASGGLCWEWRPGDRGDPCELTNLAGQADAAEVEASLHDLLAAAVRTQGAGTRFSGREARKRDRKRDRD